MTIEVHDINGTAVVALTGDVDLQSSPGVRQKLLECLEKSKRLVADLGAVSYIDSSGLATLIEYVQKAFKFRGQFALGGVSVRLRTVFDLARLGEVFPIHDSVEAAKAALAKGA